MPEQKSEVNQPITTAEFTAPFATEIWPFGLGGINMKDQIDQVPVGQYTRLLNFTHTMDRGMVGRPGMTAAATAGTNHHSMRRLNDPQGTTFTRIWGVDQSLYRGQSGALAVIDAGGYSGDPLYLVPHRPPLSGDPWMFVADRSKMRKVREDGLVVPIGLPAPAAVATNALAARRQVSICNFDIGSDTDPALWTKNKGFTYDDPPVQTDLPEILAITAPDPDDTAAIHFGRIASTARPTGDYVYFGLPLVRDLSTFGGGIATTDDDYIHLWLNFSHPLLIEEFRIYIVVGTSFSATVLPGIPDGLGSNADAYVKSFSQDDFAAYFAAQADQISAAELSRVHAVRDSSLQNQSADGGYQTFTARGLTYTRKRPTSSPTIGTAIVRGNPATAQVVPAATGADQWHEMGVVAVPVRRGDFQRMGETANRDWSTVVGIVTMIKTGPNSGPGPVAVRLGNFYMHGGSGIDSGEPGAQPYDYRYTDYDPRTGAESNPSPVQTDANSIDSLRRRVLVTVAANASSAIRQRIYRRGGSNNDDWNFLGVNTANGAVYTDEASDDTAGAAGTVNTDHFQPIPTVDDTGATVLAQPVPVLFGPANGLLFGLGDPYRPGHLYYCIPGEPDHWGANNNVEVCPPSEELMAGGMYGAQPFCFSRSRLYLIYPNLSGDTAVSVSTSACRRGIVSRHGWTIALGGIFGVSVDGVFVTGGGAEEIISQDIQPLFRNQTWEGLAPIDFAFPNALRLSTWQDDLYLQYQDTSGNRQVMVYSLLFKFWKPYTFGVSHSYILPDEDAPAATLYIGGRTTGTSYTHDGTSDAGTPITWLARTGSWDLGRPREDKLLGDQILDADFTGVTVTLQNRLNNNTVVNTVQGMDAATGRQRFILDSFGFIPQRARNISTELTGQSATARPTLYFLGQSIIAEPDVTINRVTQWDDLNHPDESYVTGITLDVDTGGIARTIIFERDFAGVTTTIATRTVQTDGRHKVKYSWDALPCHKVRIHPNDDCKAWILYKADWIALPEPPRIAGWDIHFEADGDQYITGLDLYCTTEGQEKQIEVSVDGNVLTNPYTLEAFWRINTGGRRWVHLTFLALRGHVLHFRALDQNPGLLYSHKWWTDPEPSEQSNWNQNFSAWGITADKFLKAIVFEADTFGQNKTVRVEVDGTLADTLTVNTNGRLVQQLTLSTQKLGRIWRIYPADGNPGRLYTAVPIFDVEPYKLNRWETQEQTHGMTGFFSLLEAQVTLKSTTDVNMRVYSHTNELGTILTDDYTIPSTGGIKLMKFVPFYPKKGVLYQYLFTGGADFFLYKEESHVRLQPWGSAEDVRRQMFGNDDLDATRSMTQATLAAARSGGSA